MRESLVGFCHPMNFVTFSHGTAATFCSLHQLTSQTLRHGFFTAFGSRFTQPAHRQCHTTNRTHFNRNLIIGTADTTGRISFDLSNLPAGDYYIGVAGSTVNSPAAILVHVEGGQSTIKGDVNGDGIVNNLDAVLVYAYHNGKQTLTEAQLAAADVNGDGKVNNLDASMIYAYHNGKITQFTV